jgi:hypothetical protein
MDVHKFAREFLKQLDESKFDGRLFEELSKLSHDQLLRVTQLLAERITANRKESGGVSNADRTRSISGEVL